MLLGALLEVGAPAAAVREALAGLGVGPIRMRVTRVERGAIAARYVAFSGSEHEHHGRTFRTIRALLRKARLAPRVRERSLDVFERLARAEGRVHGVPIERVHFHEVGAIDSIVDIVGAVWAIDQLGVSQVVSSPLNVGAGTVETSHGRLPVPAPATLRLLEGAQVFSSGTPLELVTPTGALLVTGHATSFGPMPAMTVRQLGYGAGSREIKGHPNVLRAVMGETQETGAQSAVAVLECNIDDMNPQVFGYLIDRLYGLGALEVFYTPIQMKKSRPGTLVTVITPVHVRDAALDVLFQETTTIGVRHQEMLRECLSREWVTVSTPYGAVRVKVAKRGERITNAAPEFEDCAQIAAEQKVPVKDVHAAAVSAYLDLAQPATGQK